MRRPTRRADIIRRLVLLAPEEESMAAPDRPIWSAAACRRFSDGAVAKKNQPQAQEFNFLLGTILREFIAQKTYQVAMPREHVRLRTRRIRARRILARHAR